MATSWEEQLVRWQSAGLVDGAAAERIRLFEASRATGRAEASGWARLALALGACLLGAGVLLFVSAHWDGLSPGWRMAVAIAPVLAFHVAGGATMRRTPAVGADARQIVDYRPLYVGVWLAALTYLTARQDDADGAVRRALAWIGGMAILPLGVLLAATWVRAPSIGGAWVVTGWTVALLLPSAVGVALRRRRAWWNAVGAVWAAMVAAASGGGVAGFGSHPLMVHALCAAGAAGLVVWGIRERRPERINLGMAGFALTVTIFYFSDVMDKLGRSASLVGLGVLFLVGGWALERTRRSLLAGLGASDVVAQGAR